MQAGVWLTELIDDDAKGDRILKPILSPSFSMWYVPATVRVGCARRYTGLSLVGLVLVSSHLMTSHPLLLSSLYRMESWSSVSSFIPHD